MQNGITDETSPMKQIRPSEMEKLYHVLSYSYSRSSAQAIAASIGTATDHDDDVGYGKPPRAHQFKPGKAAIRKAGRRAERTRLRNLVTARLETAAAWS
jgi:hypothetical protein